MSIYFKQETMQFYLHTKQTSYVMELYENRLAHSYWGSRVNEIPNLEHYFPFWFGADFSATDIPGRRLNSTDKLPQEYPTYGTGDMRSPALQVENAAGDSITRLRYESHRIFDGKPILSGLPVTYGDDCETLEITMTDDFSGVTAILHYTVFPEKDVLFESCSGGGRFDAGMLYYMPQTWTSDDTDAVERLYIQEGTGLVYPLSTMGAHISAVPNHHIRLS